MDLHTPKYLSELNAAKDMNILDWESPSPNRYEREVLKLHLIVEKDEPAKNWKWSLRHRDRGTLTMGDAGSAELAKHEAVAYAIHFVRNAMVGVMA